MNSINDIIVKVSNDYNNNKNGLIVNDTIESVEHINREGIVISTPDINFVNVGDKIIFHHNITRQKNTTSGKRIKSHFWIENDLYRVPVQEVFLIQKNGSNELISPQCFVKPIKLNNNSFNSKENHKGNIKHQGIIYFANEELKKLGLDNGDRVIFSKWSEYEFIINNEVYYKMRPKDILGKL